jgi:fumarylacetoacetate (FAA) hydrolase
VLADEAWGIDFEGEVAVVTGDVAMGTSERTRSSTSAS